jgi:hypothetical protein
MADIGIRSVGRDLFQTKAAPFPEARPCLFDTAEEARIAFETIVKPVVFRLEADKDTGGFAMARDDDLPLFGLPQKTGKEKFTRPATCFS